MGNVYVADRNAHRMQIFTGTGDFLTKWGSNGTAEGEFSFPYGLRAGPDGLVYVSDSSNFRVQQFVVTLPEPSRDVMLACSLVSLATLAVLRQRQLGSRNGRAG